MCIRDSDYLERGAEVNSRSDGVRRPCAAAGLAPNTTSCPRLPPHPMMNTSICGLCQGFDPRPTRRRHRAKRTRRGPIGATAAGRDPGREPIHILFDITTRPLGATPLRRAGPAAAGAVPGRWPLRGRESPQDRPPGRGAQCAFTASHECDHHRVTSLRTLVMRSVVILIDYTHISTTTAALGYLSHCLLYTSPSPRDRQKSRMPSSA